MSSTVLVTTLGNKHYITDKQIADAFRELVDVGYSPVESAECALSLIIARIEADELSSEDFLYSRTDFPDELKFLASFNSKAQHKCNQITLVTT
jgi:hypothetical protein